MTEGAGTKRQRIVHRQDGAEAEVVYEIDGDRFVILHTGVPEELAGGGIGGQLVEAAVDEARRRNLVVVPVCPYARRWLQRHRDVADTVRVDWS